MATSPAQIVSLVNTELRINTLNKIWSFNTILGYVNQAIRRVELDLRFESNDSSPASSSITIIAGVAEYALPADFAELDMAQFNNGTTIFTLYPIDYQETLLLNPNNVQGQPSQYYMRGPNIGLYQIPNQSGTILILKYRKLVSDLTVGGPNLGLNDVYVPSIVKYAAYLAWSSIRGYEASAEAKKGQYIEEVGIQQARWLPRDPNGDVFRSDRRRNTLNNYSNWPRAIY